MTSIPQPVSLRPFLFCDNSTNFLFSDDPYRQGLYDFICRCFDYTESDPEPKLSKLILDLGVLLDPDILDGKLTTGASKSQTRIKFVHALLVCAMEKQWKREPKEIHGNFLEFTQVNKLRKEDSEHDPRMLSLH